MRCSTSVLSGSSTLHLIYKQLPKTYAYFNTRCIMYADDKPLLIRNRTTEGFCASATDFLNKALNYCKISDLVIKKKKKKSNKFSRKNCSLYITK